MKKFNTLKESIEALIDEDGAVYRKIKEGRGSRFRINDRCLERYSNKVNTWLDVSDNYDHGFLFDFKNWYRYEKPKKRLRL